MTTPKMNVAMNESNVTPVAAAITLPSWITAWLTTYGVNIKSFAEFATGIAQSVGTPEEWIAQAQAWLEANTSLTPDKITAFAVLAWTEFASGNPGYDKDHGADA